MSFTTQAQFYAALTDWLARDDLESYYDNATFLFETHLNRKLRVRQQETSATLAASGGSAALPTDYLLWRRVTDVGDVESDLNYVHPSMLVRTYPSDAAGPPRVFTIEGSTLKYRPTGATSLVMDYFQKITAITSSTTNWVFDTHPDLYLFGVLTEIYLLDKDEERASLWRERRDGAIAEIELLSRRTGGPAAIRSTGPTP
jgi:hypothetical protein